MKFCGGVISIICGYATAASIYLIISLHSSLFLLRIISIRSTYYLWLCYCRVCFRTIRSLNSFYYAQLRVLTSAAAIPGIILLGMHCVPGLILYLVPGLWEYPRGVRTTQTEVPVPPTQTAPLAPPKSQLLFIPTGCGPGII